MPKENLAFLILDSPISINKYATIPTVFLYNLEKNKTRKTRQVMGSQTQPKLPVIDFTKANLNPGSSLWLTTSEKVRDALEEYGCFIAIDNTVSLELRNAAFNELQCLFDLPTEIKSQSTCDTPHFSYRGPSAEFPLSEAFWIGDESDQESIPSFSNRMWPSGQNDHFCENMDSFMKSASKVDQMVTQMVFKSYSVEKHLDSHIASTIHSIRCIKYRPPVKGETDTGARAHTDKGFLTIIHQNHVQGLEINTKEGDHWVPVEFPPSSFIVMAGEAFLAWSNDRIHSVLHRVKMKSVQEIRYSIASFSHRKGITNIPEELVDDDHPLRFTSFDNFSLRNFYMTEEGKKTENTAKAYCGVR